MNIRPAVVSDAGPIASLVCTFDAVLVAEPAAAQPFWRSMSEQAHAENIASSRFRYYVAESGNEMLGFIAMRDAWHLFNLFVSAEHHRRGIGRALWNHALGQLPAIPSGAPVTVNASLNAVPVYQALGFRQAGAVVRQHGIAFVPMRCDRLHNAA